MSSYFQDNGYISRSGKQSSLHREHAIHTSVDRSSIFNPSTSHPRMETKALLVVLSLIGYSSVICGILLNIENWKSDILFCCGCVFMFLKLVRVIIKTWQSYKREEIEQMILKKKIEDD